MLKMFDFAQGSTNVGGPRGPNFTEIFMKPQI